MPRIHPLTGESKNGKPANGHARPAVEAHFAATQNRRSVQSYDAARSGGDLDGHWAYADALDADSANSRAVRHALIQRSRYEAGSNGHYDGILAAHCNMVVGATGPALRMLTGNRGFNQVVEREFYRWATAIQLRRKLLCMAHARAMDGECFCVLLTNPELAEVQLDLMPIEAEQCQTPYLPHNEKGYIDGIRFDEFGNVTWYDILPVHPGGQWAVFEQPIRVPPSQVVHWYKMVRPGQHRGKPDCTSTLNLGAWSRRFREATTAAAETAADLAAISTTTHNPATDIEPELIAPFTGIPLPKRTWAFNPMGWDITQLKGEHPGTTYESFQRQQLSELASPLLMPYNLAAHDSSSYSFASGKLDTLVYFRSLDVERQDCNDLVLDPIFLAWFREWALATGRTNIAPDHQWDWPSHPVIDSVAEANAIDTRLKNGTITLRRAYTDAGEDYEDQLAIQAEDWFGEASEESIAKARKINVLRNTPQHAVQYVAEILGLGETAEAESGEAKETEAEMAFASGQPRDKRGRWVDTGASKKNSKGGGGAAKRSQPVTLREKIVDAAANHPSLNAKHGAVLAIEAEHERAASQRDAIGVKRGEAIATWQKTGSDADRKRAESLDAEYNAKHAEVKALRADANRKAHEAIALTNERRAEVTIVQDSTSPLSEYQRANSEEASKFVRSVTDAGGKEITIGAASLNEGERASWNNGVVRTSPESPVSTHVHEYGHHLENNLPGATEAAQVFRAHRIKQAGTPDVKMAEKFPKSNYGPDEIGNEDGFGKTFGDGTPRAFYAGKRYSGGDTEILSLGIEKLYADPIGFARSDPEYFKFTVGVLDGTIRG